MADDLGYGELACYGQTKIKTPNIDQLAKEGALFTRSYSASPVCAPTRYSLLTGKHQGHADIRGNREFGGFGPNDKEGQMPISQQETTVAEVLKSRGYRTGLVGKWGLGGTQPGESPLDHGFDFFYGYLCQRRAHNYYPPYLWNGRDVDLLGNPVFSAHQKIEVGWANQSDYEDKYLGQVFSGQKLIENAIKFVSSKDKSKPFFLYFASTLPHVALQAPKEWVNKFPQDWDKEPYLGQNGYLPCARPRATYAAMIAYLDDSVGRLVATLKSTGQLDNTLFIFTSDNGATNVGGVDRTFFQSNGELRSGKMSLYEGGIRVPMVARWPKNIPAGLKIDEPVVAYDFFATVCDLVGSTAPVHDGRSYLPLLKGKHVSTRHFIYFEYPEASNMQAVMFRNYKLIKPDLNSQPQKIELYDLEKDLPELNDISSQHIDIVTEGLKIMNREHKVNKLFPLGSSERPKK